MEQLTLIVLTYNESANLGACLESVNGLVNQVFVVDSGSSDETLQIAAEAGASTFAHPFETHAKQWRWALAHLPIRTAWVLGLDADQSLTPESKAEIARFLSDTSRSPHIAGCYIKRRQIFRGRWIKHGGYYPKYLLKLFRLDKVSVTGDDLVDHHFSVDGPTLNLRHDLIEDNKREHDISVWIEKHNRYSSLQALEEYDGSVSIGKTPGSRGRLWGNPDQRTAWLKGRWRRMPLYLRPFLYFLYRYVLRLGFLDGREGFVFHFMQGYWYRLLVDVKLDELRRSQGQRSASAQPVPETSAQPEGSAGSVIRHSVP